MEFTLLQYLTTTKRQELLRQGRRTGAGLRDQIEVMTAGMRGELLRETMGMANDDHEQIVEIMRDAAGKPAQCLHFLRLAQTVLGSFVLRNIRNRLDHMNPPVRGNRFRPMHQEY